MYRGILFLSTLVNADVRTKSSICFVSYRNNIIKEVDNALLLRIVSLHMQETCGFLII